MFHRRLGVAGVLLVTACGAFGAEEPPAAPDEPLPPAQTPDDNAKGVVQGEPPVGIFVSSSKGDDTNPGTASKPFKTFAAVMPAAKQRGLRVIACAEQYTEAVKLLDGVSMFGVYDCATSEWKSTERHAIVLAPTSPAVLAEGITAPTRIEGIDFVAPDLAVEAPSENASSSYGLVVRGSANLTFANAILRAGRGAPGAGGAAAPANVENTSGAAKGVAAFPADGFASCPFLNGCTNAMTWRGPEGGKSQCKVAGNGGPGGQAGSGAFGKPCGSTTSEEAHGRPFVATATTALGGLDYCADYPNRIGGVGAGTGGYGAPGLDGPDGAHGTWAFSPDGFVLGHGSAGGNAAPGGGGGGGGGLVTFSLGCGLPSCSPSGQTYRHTATGGSGGAGGCAGLAGAAGFGGGASIGAFVVASTLVFEKTQIVSAAGGAGGAGTTGSLGLLGGDGGPGASTGGGGKGGRGGAGGLSGHGAPGPSIALAYSGARPATVETTLTPGPGGPRLEALTLAGNQGPKTLPALAGESLPEAKF